MILERLRHHRRSVSDPNAKTDASKPRPRLLQACGMDAGVCMNCTADYNVLFLATLKRFVSRVSTFGFVILEYSCHSVTLMQGRHRQTFRIVVEHIAMVRTTRTIVSRHAASAFHCHFDFFAGTVFRTWSAAPEHPNLHLPLLMFALRTPSERSFRFCVTSSMPPAKILGFSPPCLVKDCKR